jgi:hypothetical protein
LDEDFVMEFRNARYSRADKTRIDMEVNHPKWGWIPTTADLNDVEEHGRLLHAAAASVATPYQAPPPPTETQIRAAMPRLTARQLRLGLVNAGISPAQVTAALEAMPPSSDADKALIEWEYATEFNRLHPLIATVGTQLNLTADQIDTMWLASVNL